MTAAPGARIPLADRVLADIGDEQDIRESLSTFSAHMGNLAAIVRSASKESLVVLDEVGVGTDPGEGAALGQAVLEALADRGVCVVTTTHYNLLKELADELPKWTPYHPRAPPQSLQYQASRRHLNVRILCFLHTGVSARTHLS